MKKFISGLTIAFIAMFSVNTAIAQNIHYIDGPTTLDNGTTLTTCGKLAGLGNNKGITITVKTTATITTECRNPAGHVVPGQSRTEEISVSKTFYSDKNGNVSWCLTTLDQKPGICPNGKWTGRVTDVSFVNTNVWVNGKKVSK